MENFFEQMGKKLGFGCMRLPMNGEEVDLAQFCAMADAFLDRGYRYFDTAKGYIKGQSETALRHALTSRYDRDRYWLTDKLSGPFFQKREEIMPLFEEQLKSCGVEYFDCYLLHAQSRWNYDRFLDCGAYEITRTLRDQGRVRHVGISFHDTADVLERILTEQPWLEVVQLQFNYADYGDPEVQAGACFEVCKRHGKPVFVMEPVKGGRLANLPQEAGEALGQLPGTPASYALRFAGQFPEVKMVLSGMSTREQMGENLDLFDALTPLTPEEQGVLDRVVEVLRRLEIIPCTGCRYCVDGCPQRIPIPEIFTLLNGLREGKSGDYEGACAGLGRASECLQCGLCEDACPQHLEIRRLLKRASWKFERK